ERQLVAGARLEGAPRDLVEALEAPLLEHCRAVALQDEREQLVELLEGPSLLLLELLALLARVAVQPGGLEQLHARSQEVRLRRRARELEALLEELELVRVELV